MASKSSKKNSQVIKDAQGNEWRATQGGHYRNTKTGKLYSGKGSPADAQQQAPATGEQQAQPFNFDPYNYDLNSPAGVLAAQQQANLASAAQQAAFNRPNEATPFGSSSYKLNDDGTISRDFKLSEGEQKKYDQETARETGINDFANNQLMSQGFQNLSQPFNYNLMPQVYNPSQNYDAEQQRVQDQVYGTYKKRLDTQFAQEKDQLEQNLANRGIPRNSEAYNFELQQFDKRKNDAYDSALTAGIGAGQSAQAQAFNQGQGMFQTSLQNRQQAIGEGLDQRQRPFSEMANLLQFNKGVNIPQFSQFQGVNMPGVDVGGSALGFANMQNNLDAIKLQGKNQLAAARAAGGGGGGGESLADKLAYQKELLKYQSDLANQNKPKSANPWLSLGGNIAGSFASGIGQGLGGGNLFGYQLWGGSK